MFFLVGVIYDRAHHRNLDNFRGLYEPMPLYGGISAIIFFAALGLPGLCGFVGEFMVVLGDLELRQGLRGPGGADGGAHGGLHPVDAPARLLGTNPAYKDYPDINFRELLCIVPLVVLAVRAGRAAVAAAELDGAERHRTGRHAGDGCAVTVGWHASLRSGVLDRTPRSTSDVHAIADDARFSVLETLSMTQQLLDALQNSLSRDMLAFLPELILCGTIVLLLLLRLFPRLRSPPPGLCRPGADAGRAARQLEPVESCNRL